MSFTLSAVAQNLQTGTVLDKIRSMESGQNAQTAFVVPPWFHQQRSWVDNPSNSDSAAYNFPFALRITGYLDDTLLQRALHELQTRHQVFRSVFNIIDEDVVQIVQPPQPLEMRKLDLTERPDTGQTLTASLLREIQRPFHLVCEPALRILLVKTAPADHILLLNTHHIVCDDWSTGVIASELSRLYRAFSAGDSSPLPPLSFHYSDFISWQQRRLNGGKLQSGLSFWKGRFSDRKSFFHLTPDYDRPASCTHWSGTDRLTLSEDLVQALSRVSEQNKVTVFMTLLAAFKYVLRCYSGETDIAVGTCAANRPLAAVEGLIGRFANDLVMRCDLSGNPTSSELLRRVRDVALNAYGYQDVPFGGVLNALFPVKDPGCTPLFQVILILQNSPRLELDTSDLSWRYFPVETRMAKYDLAVWLKMQGGIQVAFEYDKSTFAAETIRQMLQAYQSILTAMVSSPEKRLDEILSTFASAAITEPSLASPAHEEMEPGTKDQRSMSEQATAATIVEVELSKIWNLVLGTSEVAPGDDFFALGGDSVRATQLLIRLEEQFGIELSLDLLLVRRTFEQQAQLLRERRSGTSASAASRGSTDKDIDQPPIQKIAPSTGAGPSSAESRGSNATRPGPHSNGSQMSLARKCVNRILHLLCRIAPGATSVRPFLHRLRGVQIRGRVAIGDDVYIENEYPQCVEIEDGAMIGLRSTIIAHTRGAGKIIIGRNAFVGANCVLVTSGNRVLKIGEGSVIMASSVITNDVLPHTLYGMQRAQPLAKVTRPFTQETTYEELIAALRPLGPPSPPRG